MRALIYSRVSTDAQERDGTSLETQERACAQHARLMGWQVVECIRDTASGYTLDRPGIERVRKLVQEGQVDTIMAYAVDRLSRNQNQIGVLVDEAQSWGARLEFVTEKFEDTAVGRFILAARAFSAEVEREKITERTMRGKAERARSGRIPQGTGRGCFGYQYSPATGRREIDPAQAVVVQRIFERFCLGESCHGIAVRLNQEGFQALGGGAWHPLTVRRILDNEAYTGRTIYRRTRVTTIREPRSGKKRRRVVYREPADWIEVVGATPLVITPELFARTQTILHDPHRRLDRRPSLEYRLRGRLRCMVCGTPMVGHALSKGRYRYYRCRRTYSGYTQGGCDSRYVPVDLLERTVLEELTRLLSDPEVLLSEAQRLNVENGEASRLAEVRRRLTW